MNNYRSDKLREGPDSDINDQWPLAVDKNW